MAFQSPEHDPSTEKIIPRDPPPPNIEFPARAFIGPHSIYCQPTLYISKRYPSSLSPLFHVGQGALYRLIFSRLFSLGTLDSLQPSSSCQSSSTSPSSTADRTSTLSQEHRYLSSLIMPSHSHEAKSDRLVPAKISFSEGKRRIPRAPISSPSKTPSPSHPLINVRQGSPVPSPAAR